MRLVDIDALSHEMYHMTFETNSNMQKWDGGCWIRYRMFEKCRDNAPTIDAVQVVRCQDCKWYDKKHPNGTVCCNDFFCKFYRTFNPPYHFCALGERRL